LHSFSIALSVILDTFLRFDTAPSGCCGRNLTRLSSFDHPTYSEPNMFSTEKRPVAQAIVLYLQRPYSELDGERARLIAGIFGPGNVAGTGEALEEYGNDLPFYWAKNEQSMVAATIGYARAENRTSTFA
jgi:hypothetical protein